MREIIIDTETTGFDPLQGHRIVEIGCVELMHFIPTGRTYQAYINPERPVPSEASAVHGLHDDFLATKPVFAEVVEEFLNFLGDDTAPLIAHNASFDMNFLNAELSRLGYPALNKKREVVDTVMIARRKFPGAPASLDALCKRFKIDTTSRTLHGALLDSQLLADVYLELRGGRSPELASGNTETKKVQNLQATAQQRAFIAPRSYDVSADEGAAHEKFLEQIKNPIWKKA